MTFYKCKVFTLSQSKNLTYMPFALAPDSNKRAKYKELTNHHPQHIQNQDSRHRLHFIHPNSLDPHLTNKIHQKDAWQRSV